MKSARHTEKSISIFVSVLLTNANDSGIIYSNYLQVSCEMLAKK